MKIQLNTPVQPIDSTLEERGTRYGAFSRNADISQKIKDILRASPSWGTLSYDKREAMEMIAHKLARILNGDPEYIDSWHDISGYATLIVDNLEHAIADSV